MNKKVLLCSNCFTDHGLKLDSEQLGFEKKSPCPNCKSVDGRKLNSKILEDLSHRFFVKGTLHKMKYGAAPIIQANFLAETDIDVTQDLKKDIELLRKTINVRFFYYGPRFWMIGEVEPLKKLTDSRRRKHVINDILKKYPSVIISSKDYFYRLRKNPKNPSQTEEYDSSPISGKGRLDEKSLPILYASQDLEVCVHECRVTVEDDLYVATLQPTRDLKLLDLTELIQEEDVTEFESLDIAIQMLFFAGKHAYRSCRAISQACISAGYDGIIYPSYFSSYRTGSIPFDTVYGISIRKFPQYTEYAKSQIIQNLALFGKPIQEKKVNVKCLNKLLLNKVKYDIHFGPVKY